MLNFARVGWRIGCLVAFLPSVTLGGDPTFSLEVAQVNSVRVHGGPVGQITVAPGDTVTLEVYVRDWSPSEEHLSAYQAQIDHANYTSALSGFVEPVGYDPSSGSKPDNRGNCFVDKTHPRFVHAGFDTLAMTDSKSPSYRWLSVLLQDPGPVSSQDGAERYCGTINMLVSDNAQGTFTLRLDEEDASSGLRDEGGYPIVPVAFEPALVTVDPEASHNRPPPAAADVVSFLSDVNGPDAESVAYRDLTGDGRLGPRDLLRAVDLLNKSQP